MRFVEAYILSYIVIAGSIYLLSVGIALIIFKIKGE